MTSETTIDPLNLIRPCRKIRGMSAVLLPFSADGSIDWESFELLLERTIEAGLTPAVNMDTGYVNLIDEQARQQVLDKTCRILNGVEFVAGAFVGDRPESEFQLDRYQGSIDLIQRNGGVPIVFQSFGLTAGSADEVIGRYQSIADCCDRFLAFELGEMFAPFGKIYDLDVYQALLKLPSCIGAKHSSLDRILEWERLILRDQTRPEFMVLTGNDLAIDMVMYGSDYLLGLSAFCPDMFALRDRWWEEGDARFYQLNDWLQYLGHLAFRPPVSGYKHDAAMFLYRRHWIKSDQPHPEGVVRPETDREILSQILDALTDYSLTSGR